MSAAQLADLFTDEIAVGIDANDGAGPRTMLVQPADLRCGGGGGYGSDGGHRIGHGVRRGLAGAQVHQWVVVRPYR